MGAGVWRAALIQTCLTGGGAAKHLFSPLLWVCGFRWFLFGYGMELWIAAYSVLILTKLIVQQWRGRHDQQQLPSLFVPLRTKKQPVHQQTLVMITAPGWFADNLFCF